MKKNITDIIFFKVVFMQLSIIALASSEWGVARFTTDSFAIVALAVLTALPIILLKGKLSFKNVWSNENALSSK